MGEFKFKFDSLGVVEEGLIELPTDLWSASLRSLSSSLWNVGDNVNASNYREIKGRLID